MKYLSRLPFALIICAVAHASVPSPGPIAKPSPESIEKLLVMTDVQKLITNLQLQIDTSIRMGIDQSVKGKPLTPAAQQLADSLRVKITADFNQDLNWEKMKDLYIKIYSETFTQEQIDQLIAFYQTPVGKTYVEKMPGVIQKSTFGIRERMGPIMQRTRQSVQDAIQQVTALQSKTAAPAPSSSPAPATASPGPKPAHP